MALPALLQIVGGAAFLGNRYLQNRAENKRQANIQATQQQSLDLAGPLLSPFQRQALQGMALEDGEAAQRQLLLELNRNQMQRNADRQYSMQLGDQQMRRQAHQAAMEDRDRANALAEQERMREKERRELLARAQTDQNAAREYSFLHDEDADGYMAPFTTPEGRIRKEWVPHAGTEASQEGRVGIQETTAFLRNINELDELVEQVGIQSNPRLLTTAKAEALVNQIQSVAKGADYMNLGASLFGSEADFLFKQFPDATSMRNWILDNPAAVRQALSIGGRLATGRLEQQLDATRRWDGLDDVRTEAGLEWQRRSQADGRLSAQQAREAAAIQQREALESARGGNVGTLMDQARNMIEGVTSRANVVGQAAFGGPVQYATAVDRLRAVQAEGAALNQLSELPGTGAGDVLVNQITGNPVQTAATAGALVGGAGIGKLATRLFTR